MGAGALVLTFGRLFQHVQSLPSSNSTSQQIQSLPSSNSTSQQIQYVTNNLVSSYKGTLPVILTCPHNGNQQPPGVSERTNLANCSGFTVIPDAYTRIITIELAQSILKNFGKAPYVVIAEFHRKYIDANAVPACAYESLNAQIYYNEYHNTIRKYVDEIRNQYNGTGFLFDIHASVVFPDDHADL
jgi:N-formylglutamate amidohydrolase